MESLFPIVLSLLLCLLLLFTFSLISPRRTPSKLPPGPRKLPFIGNLLNLAGALPHRVLQGLSMKYGPLMHLQLGEVRAIVVSSPKMAEVFMRTHDINFASRPTILMSEIMLYGTKDLIFAPYGEYWRMVRKICTSELLSKKRVQSFRYAREEQYLDLVRWIASHRGMPINFSKKIFSKSYETTSRIAFGQRCKEHEEFISMIEEVLMLSSGFDIGDLFPSYKLLLAIGGGRKLKQLHKRVDQILVDIIKAHREKADRRSRNEAEEDLIDVLLKYEQGADQEFTLTLENVKALILDVFMAGSDTSATVIDWTLAELIRTPKVLKRAQSEVRKLFEGKKTVSEEKLGELTFLKMVIKESLRLHPPVPLLVPRETRENCTINGYEIPYRAKVIINAWAINRDPEFWKNGDAFDPDRFQDSSVDFRGSNFEFIPFGAGRRMCPGMDFGLASVELVLSLLLYHFDWELPEGVKRENLDMTEWFGATGKRMESLFLIPTVYQDPPPV